MSPNTTTIILELTTILGAALVAQYVAGRLHAILSPDEATTIRLELVVIAAVILYLLLQASIAIALELPGSEPFEVGLAKVLNPTPPPPA